MCRKSWVFVCWFIGHLDVILDRRPPGICKKGCQHLFVRRTVREVVFDQVLVLFRPQQEVQKGWTLTTSKRCCTAESVLSLPECMAATLVRMSCQITWPQVLPKRSQVVHMRRLRVSKRDRLSHFECAPVFYSCNRAVMTFCLDSAFRRIAGSTPWVGARIFELRTFSIWHVSTGCTGSSGSIKFWLLPPATLVTHRIVGESLVAPVPLHMQMSSCPTPDTFHVEQDLLFEVVLLVVIGGRPRVPSTRGSTPPASIPPSMVATVRSTTPSTTSRHGLEEKKQKQKFNQTNCTWRDH